MRRRRRATVLAVACAASIGACGDGVDPQGQPAWDGSVNPECDMALMQTPDQIEQPCGSWRFLPIPLEDGSFHGPATVPGGIYGGKIEWNQGAETGFENPVNVLEAACYAGTIELVFGEPRILNQYIKDTHGMKYGLYTVFRPAHFKPGEKYPVIVWANGTCGATLGYATLLSSLASRGYVVIAPNSTWTSTAPTDSVQTRAIDYAESLNADPYSIFHQKLDLDRIGAMGHSQGAGATGETASDPRVKSVILWNWGASNDKPFLNISADRDTPETSPESIAADTDNATQPGAWVYYHEILETGGNYTGHLVLMEQPERVYQLAVSWWDYMLKGDPKARQMFVGETCGLCTSPEEFEYGHNRLFD